VPGWRFHGVEAAQRLPQHACNALGGGSSTRNTRRGAGSLFGTEILAKPPCQFPLFFKGCSEADCCTNSAITRLGDARVWETHIRDSCRTVLCKQSPEKNSWLG
jgi:hypothetical protein